MFSRHAEGYRKMYEDLVDEMIAQLDAPSARQPMVSNHKKRVTSRLKHLSLKIIHEMNQR